MAKSTSATRQLEKAGIAFNLHSYDYDPDAKQIGLAAALALGLEPEQTFKTLMTLVDGRPVCVVIASNAEVSMKKLSTACAAKSAMMMKPVDAERMTGYKVGGISPFGQKKQVLTFMDETAQLFDIIYINAGQRGLLLSIAPLEAQAILMAQFYDLTA